MLASALRTDRSSFRHVEPQNPDIITLRELNRTREELVGERTRLVNRLRELLWRYYPQFNELMGTAVRPWHLELWALAPEPAVANRVRVSTVRKLLRRHRIRRLGAEAVFFRTVPFVINTIFTLFPFMCIIPPKKLIQMHFWHLSCIKRR